MLFLVSRPYFWKKVFWFHPCQFGHETLVSHWWYTHTHRHRHIHTVVSLDMKPPCFTGDIHTHTQVRTDTDTQPFSKHFRNSLTLRCSESWGKALTFCPFLVGPPLPSSFFSPILLFVITTVPLLIWSRTGLSPSNLLDFSPPLLFLKKP